MVNRIRTIYPRRLNLGFSSMFYVGSRVLRNTPEEGRMAYRPKRYKNEGNSPNILSDKQI